MSRSKMLITGFGPFNEFKQNPSGDFAQAIHGKSFSGIEMIGQQLDVTWSGSWERIEKLINIHQPICLLGLGLAPESCIRLECIATNRTYPHLDNKGMQPLNGFDSRILLQAPKYYSSKLPLEMLYKRYINSYNVEFKNINTHLVPIRMSRNAGDYLCNFIFYKAVHLLEENVPHRGFIHTPSYGHVAQDFEVAKARIFKSLTLLVEELAEWLSSQPSKKQLLT